MNIDITITQLIQEMVEVTDNIKSQANLRKPHLDGLTHDRLRETIVTMKKATIMLKRSNEFLTGNNTEDSFNNKWDQEQKGV